VLYILHGRGSTDDRELRPARRPCLLLYRYTYNVGLLFYREPDYRIVHLRCTRILLSLDIGLVYVKYF